MKDLEAYENKTMNIDQGEAIKKQIIGYVRFWPWFVLCLLIALMVAYFSLRYTPKIYSSSAKIKILNKTKGLELPSSAFVFNRSNINLENEIEIVKSYRIIEKVVRTLDLTVRRFEMGNVLTTEIDNFPFKFDKIISNDSISSGSSYNIEIDDSGFKVYRSLDADPVIIPNYNSYVVNHDLPFELRFSDIDYAKQYVGKSYVVKFISISQATKRLKGSINVSMLGKGSDLLKLSHKGQSKYRSERTLNTLIEVFNQDGINDRQEVSKRTIVFIEERFKSLVRELDSIELDIKDFKKNNNFINIESDAEIGLTQRTTSENQVFEVENQLMVSELLKETLENDSKSTNLLPSNIGINNSSINELVNQYNELVFQLDNLSVSGGSNNPQVEILRSKLVDVQDNIDVSINSYREQLKATKNQLEKRNFKYANQVSSLPLKEKLLRSRLRQQTIKQTLYIFLLQKYEEAAINLAITEPSIKVVEYALSSGGPISPNPRNTYLMAAFLGLIVPFGIVYGFKLLNTKISGKSDVVNKVGNIPILAELPKIKNGNTIFENPLDRSAQAEAFRILSANVDYILPPVETSKNITGKVICCTSTIKGEGKTYVGINLSLALSSINKKVLLIGADLRNPQIHSYVSANKNELGLVNYLYSEKFSWKDCLIKGFDKHPNHDILISGSIPPNPTQLLTNGRFTKLIEEAKPLYDYIIIDTAPTILVTDTLLISKLADATLYLVRANYTEKNLLEFSKSLKDTGKLKNMAYVINGVGFDRSYGYSYNYGYGYGYGSEITKRSKWPFKR